MTDSHSGSCARALPRWQRQTRHALIGLPLLLVLASCSHWQRVDEREVSKSEEVASIGVAIVSAAPFELYASDLSPKFEIDAATALRLVGASTRQIEDSFARATQMMLRLAPEVLTSERRTNSMADATGALSSSSAASSVARAGDWATVPAATLPEAVLPTPLAASAPSGINPMLQHQLASALIQEVRLLNDYVQRAPRAQGHARYIVRLQLNVQQKGRNTPFDAITEIHFKTSAGACGPERPVQAVPLLVNDNIDIAAASVGTNRINALGLALAGVRGNVGAAAEFSKVSAQLLRSLGSEFNSVLSVGQAPAPKPGEPMRRGGIQVKVGAVEKGVGQHELVSRSYMVTVLLLVPECSRDLTTRQERAAAEASALAASAANAALSSQQALAWVGTAIQRGMQLEAEIRNDELSRFFAKVGFETSTRFEHARKGRPVDDSVLSNHGEVELWTWPGPRLPSPQLARVELTPVSAKESDLFTGTVQLRGGDSLVQRLFDRACLLGTDPPHVNPKGRACENEKALLADSVTPISQRNGVEAKFASRLERAPDSKSPVRFGSTELKTFCIDYFEGSAGPRPDGSVCTKLEAALPRKVEPELPALEAIIRAADARLIADSLGSAVLTLAVEWKPERRPSEVRIDVSGADIRQVRRLGGVKDCAVLATSVVVNGDCLVAIDLGNAAPGRLVKVTAKAYGKADKPVDLSLKPDVFEVILRPPEVSFLSRPTPP